ncbi:MAG: hypothetical protein M3N34_07530 [Pseudomonadota bacterium]|nr:hypothetical protein [Pseudomonadota bacterium]
MIDKFRSAGIALIISTLCAVSLAATAEAKNYPSVPNEWRSGAPKLPMLVIVPDPDLQAGRDPSQDDTNKALYTNGLLTGVLTDILVKNQSKHASQKDEELRLVAKSLDPISLLANGIRKGIAISPWISLPDDGVRIVDYADASKAIDKEFGMQRGIVVNCSYNISTHFHAIYALCAINILDPEPKNEGGGDGAIVKRKIVFDNSVEAEVDLADASGDGAARLARWEGNSGELLREGLPKAVRLCGEMVGQLLEMNQSQLDALNSSKKYWFIKRFVAEVASHHGPIVDGSEHIKGYQTVEMVYKSPIPEPGTDGIMILDDGSKLDGNNFYRKLAIGAP